MNHERDDAESSKRHECTQRDKNIWQQEPAFGCRPITIGIHRRLGDVSGRGSESHHDLGLQVKFLFCAADLQSGPGGVQRLPSASLRFKVPPGFL
jgi:hypothetical protein